MFSISKLKDTDVSIDKKVRFNYMQPTRKHSKYKYTNSFKVKTCGKKIYHANTNKKEALEAILISKWIWEQRILS